MKLLRQTRWIRSGLWSVGLIGLCLAVPQARAFAVDAPSATSALGAWDVSETDGPRKCRITLRAPGAIGMPAGCRKALPLLGAAGAWSVSKDHKLALADRGGRVILAFAPAADDRLVATGPDGETYEIAQVGHERAAPPAAEVAAPVPASVSADASLSPIHPTPPRTRTAVAAAPAPAATSATTVAADPVAPVVPFTKGLNEVAGRYTILREDDRDVGCLLTLDAAAHGPGGHKAQLAPACRDQGIVVFDPVGWTLDRGHLILRARKGHDLRLVFHADGVWRKDIKEGGKPIAFKKI